MSNSRILVTAFLAVHPSVSPTMAQTLFDATRARSAQEAVEAQKEWAKLLRLDVEIEKFVGM